MNEKKLDFTGEIENFWESRPSLLRMNAAGTVPVLVDINGSIISDDTAIAEYLEEAYSEHSFSGENLTQKAEIRRLTSWFDKKFYNECSGLLFTEKVLKRYKKDGKGPDSQALRNAKNAINFHFEYISWLVDRRNWLAGENFSIADMSAAAHISTVDYYGDAPFERYQSVKDWYMRIKSRPTFRCFLHDRLPGFLPSEHYANLDF